MRTKTRREGQQEEAEEEKEEEERHQEQEGSGKLSRNSHDDETLESWPFSSRYLTTSLLVCGFAFFVRVLVSMHSYSGARTPPRFGDYEAQRHWMEITIHTPVVDWYRNTLDNNVGWWGLDYPPLTAYQSYVHGLFVHAFEPQAVALHSSRGFETPSSKILMRWTVLSSDLLVFFPAALWFLNVFYSHRPQPQRIWALAIMLLQPALLLIDHGHFQYNCISLGLAIGAAAAVVSKKELLACVLFSLSLNHKQMSMYYAPAFFAHLLGRALQRRNPLLRVFWLGCTVISTFVLCWLPYLQSTEAALEVLARIAPLKRGLYEDYVANFWCGTAMIFKWKHMFDQQTLAKLALGVTVSAIVPSMVKEIRAPSGKGFVYAMLNSSFAFYFFSYQVHEKSILLPVIPASLLALEDPRVVQWLIPFAMFSMLPLLLRDGLVIPYLSLTALFFLIIAKYPLARTEQKKKKRKESIAGPPPVVPELPGAGDWFTYASFLGAVILHLPFFGLQPPKRYPFLFEAFIMSYSFAHLLALAVYTSWKQWSIPVDGTSKQKVSSRANEASSKETDTFWNYYPCHFFMS